MLIDSEESNADDFGNYFQLMTNLTQPYIDLSSAVRLMKTKVNEEDIQDEWCTLCVGSKSTQMVRRDKTMTLTINKLEEVHTDFWGHYNLPSQSGSFYAAILMCEYIQKTRTLYLQGKDDFVDIFQV